MSDLMVSKAASMTSAVKSLGSRKGNRRAYQVDTWLNEDGRVVSTVVLEVNMNGIVSLELVEEETPTLW